MNWQHLKYFMAVADEQHVTRAASQLFISPSSLSRAMAALEDELGAKLFTRDGRGLRLTACGIEFSKYVKSAIALIEDGCAAVDRMKGSERSCVRLCAPPSTSLEYIVPLTHKFMKISPGTDIRLRQAFWKEALQRVSDGRADIGFIIGFPDDCCFDCIEKVPFIERRFTLLVPSGHKLAQRGSITPGELADETFISFNDDSPLTRHIERLFERRGHAYRKTMYAGDCFVVAELVSSGAGIGLIQDETALKKKPGVSSVNIADDDFKITTYMMWKRDTIMTETANELRHFILTEIAPFYHESGEILPSE